MDLWTQIRNLYYNQRFSQRKIARKLGIHRSTVKRAIETRGGPRYERKARYRSKLDSFKAEIQQMIADANGDIMATVIYERLVQREDTELQPKYCGSYETLCRYVSKVKGVRSKKKEAFLRIETPPGFDAQCDWGKVNLVIDGQLRRLSMFVLTLSYSRLRYARLFLTDLSLALKRYCAKDDGASGILLHRTR